MQNGRLTEKQKNVYFFIRDYFDRNRSAPYIREIQAGLNINSHKSVIDRLLALEKKGYIRRKINKHRSIRLSHNHLPTENI
jgi:repressor LexA